LSDGRPFLFEYFFAEPKYLLIATKKGEVDGEEGMEEWEEVVESRGG
jgi:hypothetical protein